jgi:hypothetical protein
MWITRGPVENAAGAVSGDMVARPFETFAMATFRSPRLSGFGIGTKSSLVVSISA